MKNLKFIALVAIAAMTIASCGNKTSKMESDVDSFSYAVGMLNGSQLKQYLSMQGVDSAQIDDFMKGFSDGMAASGDSTKAAYIMGVQMGMNMVQGISKQVFGPTSTEKISETNLYAGIQDGLDKNFTTISLSDAERIANELGQKIKASAAEKQYKDNIEAGKKFLADNAKKPGVKTLPSGVQYKVIKEGNGPLPTDTATVKLNYEGKLIDGTVFDSSYKRGEPIKNTIKGFVPGFTEAVMKMPVGSTWEIYIPAALAYGEREMGEIKPFSTLIFKVELLSIEATPKAAPAPVPMPKTAK